jgi:hypothetical protein
MDWISLAMGAGLGITAGGLFFSALALNVRAAARTRQPGVFLLAGATVRIGLLLLAGLGAAQIGALSGVGFGAGFLVARSAALVLAREVG